MSSFLARFLADESGATAIEYGLIASLISVALITGGRSLGTNVGLTFTKTAANMTK
jgi:pilus assembly protein Flp/PilA